MMMIPVKIVRVRGDNNHDSNPFYIADYAVGIVAIGESDRLIQTQTANVC